MIIISVSTLKSYLGSHLPSSELESEIAISNMCEELSSLLESEAFQKAAQLNIAEFLVCKVPLVIRICKVPLVIGICKAPLVISIRKAPLVISTCNNSSHLRKKVSHSLEIDESLPCAMLATIRIAFVNVGVGTRLQKVILLLRNQA